jgi:aryl-alcohol dehydrogenase-like predicted oxidoreductase
MGPVLAKGGALDGALRLKDRGLVGHVGFGMRPHDFHIQALDTGAVDVMLTFSDYNLLRRSAAKPGGLLERAASHGVGVLNGFSIMRGILTGAPVAEAAERGRWTNHDDIARATAMRQWAIEREVRLLDIALQFCLAETRIHGNPLGNQNIAELEQNVIAVSKPLPDGILKEFMGAAL